MSKTQTFQDLVVPPPQAQQQLWRWLYAEIRSAILDGRLRRGGRLPSTRSLAAQYAVSRGTVVSAFNQLRAEGFVESRQSAGTYVALHLPEHTKTRMPQHKLSMSPSRATISRRAKELLDNSFVLKAPTSIGRAFRSYEPAIDLFPVDLWARVAGRVLRHAPRSLYGQGNPAGYQPLRREIAGYLGASRGVRCDPGQIIVTAGAQQALDLVARLLLDVGDQVWMEDPGYPGARHAMSAAGAMVIPIPVDQDGLDVEQGRQIAPNAKLAYVTPANQFPLGIAMSAGRRLELLNWAVASGAWIVEDEYDAEYRYSGKPIAALQSLDRSDTVIYVGTFTKMLFNALRLGFIVLPQRLVEAFEAIRSSVDRHPPTLDQAVLAEFISEGHFGHHVRNMREIYAERMGVLKEASRKRLTGLLDVMDAPAGMRTVGWLQHGSSDESAARRALGAGIETFPISRFTMQHAQRPGLLLGFAGCAPSELRRGVNVLAQAFESRATGKK